jgi:hypothetical protein
MTNDREPAYSRYAWIVLVVLGLLQVEFAATLFLTGPSAIDNATTEILGQTWSAIAPGSSDAVLVDYLARSWAVGEAFIGIAMIAIAAFPFRRGDRWSWFLMWLFPATALVAVAQNLVAGVTSVVFLDTAEALLIAVVLVLPYRRFFPASRVDGRH